MTSKAPSFAERRANRRQVVSDEPRRRCPRSSDPALEADLVGPFDVASTQRRSQPRPERGSRGSAHRTLALVPVRVSRAAGTPPGGPRAAARDDAFSDQGEERPDEADEEPAPREQKRQWPASIGVTLLLPERTRSLEVTVRWADYVREDPMSPARRVCRML